jgi:hypothetical protein
MGTQEEAVMPRLSIDHTWYAGPLYFDIGGSLAEDFQVGVTIRFPGNPLDSFGRSISVYLAFWCVTVGLNE